MSVLCDKSLIGWAIRGGLSPFSTTLINPASVDLRWSGKFRLATPDGWTDVSDVDSLTLFPGQFFLLDTLEYVSMPEWAVGKLFLKSSAGRKGIEHLHAGYVDPGFEGTLTLEIEIRVPWSVTINKYDKFVQLTLETMDFEPEVSYKKKGHYVGQRNPTTAWEEAK